MNKLTRFEVCVVDSSSRKSICETLRKKTAIFTGFYMFTQTLDKKSTDSKNAHWNFNGVICSSLNMFDRKHRLKFTGYDRMCFVFIFDTQNKRTKIPSTLWDFVRLYVIGEEYQPCSLVEQSKPPAAFQTVGS